MSHFAQPAITCSNLIIETLEQGVKYVQIKQKHQNDAFEQVNAGWVLSMLYYPVLAVEY